MSNVECVSIRLDKIDPMDRILAEALDKARTTMPRATYVKQLLWAALVEMPYGTPDEMRVSQQ